MAKKEDPHAYQSGRISRRAGGAPPPPPQNRNAYGSVFDYDDAPAHGYEEQRYTVRRAPQNRNAYGSVFDYEEAGAGPAPAGEGGWEEDAAPPARPRREKRRAQAPARKKRRWPKVALALLLVLAVSGALVMNYLGDVFNTGILGSVKQALGMEPSAYKGVVHILVVGIDNEEGRSYGAGLGLTDMILYCRYDTAQNQMNMLQIPRDSFVGDSLPTGGTGKINALLISGEDKQNPINNLAGPFQQMFRLPVDHYVALDMDAMKSIVNAFGGIRVYVPQAMSHDGSHLDAGWQWLNGDAAEFFVRNRKGSGFERGDVDRLDNQRHFYSAVFRRMLNMTPGDIVNLLPVIKEYCNTDLPLAQMVSIAVAGLNLQPEKVLFCKAPGATADLDGSGRSMYYIDLYGRGTEQDPGLASLLNQYFRAEGEAVAAGELGLPQIQIPADVALYPPNVQGMAHVQEGEGGADVEVEWQAG